MVCDADLPNKGNGLGKTASDVVACAGSIDGELELRNLHTGPP